MLHNPPFISFQKRNQMPLLCFYGYWLFVLTTLTRCHTAGTYNKPGTAPEKDTVAQATDTIPHQYTKVIDSMGLMLIKGGEYDMGCIIEHTDCEDHEKPAHRVQVSDFYIGAYEVTQATWASIMGKNPSRFKDCSNCPVENVTWDECQRFLRKLNAQYPGKNYRLPTEAEWEYAARAGGQAVRFGNGKNIANPSEMRYNGDLQISDYSIERTYPQGTSPVGSFAPNALGLYDMSGNVAEWCSDWYEDYTSSTANNPTGAATGTSRVYRGGAWGAPASHCRVTYRSGRPSCEYSAYLGFRLARTP
jgi:formylglycine-generating enzyme